MSSEGSLTSSEYTETALKMAEENNIVTGVICQRKLSDKPDIIHMTPGIRVGHTTIYCFVCRCTYFKRLRHSWPTIYITRNSMYVIT